MKTAVVFYSFGGSTRKYANEEAKERNADIFEVKEAKKTGIFGAFLKGCPAAMKQKAVKLKGEKLDLSGYDTIVIGAPIWAGFPAPAFNSIVNMLPSGKNIELMLVSGSGDSSKSAEAVKALVEKTGSKVVSYRDIKTGK